jgi:hypothetical protein
MRTNTSFCTLSAYRVMLQAATARQGSGLTSIFSIITMVAISFRKSVRVSGYKFGWSYLAYGSFNGYYLPPPVQIHQAHHPSNPHVATYEINVPQPQSYHTTCHAEPAGLLNVTLHHRLTCALVLMGNHKTT